MPKVRELPIDLAVRKPSRDTDIKMIFIIAVPSAGKVGMEQCQVTVCNLGFGVALTRGRFAILASAPD